MNKPLHPIALFRLSVLGPLISREALSYGERKKLLKYLSQQTYHIPNSQRVHISHKTIEGWYYLWLHHGVDGLEPKTRTNKGKTHLKVSIQEKILQLKRENLSRSIPTIIQLLETRGDVSRNSLSKSSVHRFLLQHNLSRRTISPANIIERRSFEAVHAGDIWYGDVMHGPSIQTKTGKKKKTYLVTIFDDASRLVCHSKFCLNESSISIEYVLKESLLKRGLPIKLIVDNGPAYRAKTLQEICARLNIHLIYGKPYEPQSKGKLERWHRTVRDRFLSECNLDAVESLEGFNARLWIWIETIYHKTVQSALPNKMTPLERFQKDLDYVKPLGEIANTIDTYFFHRIKRQVKKDGTLSWNNSAYEVPFELSEMVVLLVIEPHTQKAKFVESLEYEYLGEIAALDKYHNLSHKRSRPKIKSSTSKSEGLVEIAYQQEKEKLDITNKE